MPVLQTSQGAVYVANTFENFMHPAVDWVNPTDFEKAFAELTAPDPTAIPRFLTNAKDTPMSEAAYTEANAFPGFLNAKRLDEQTVRVTLRPSGAEQGATQQPSHLDVPIDEWHDFMAGALRVSQSAGMRRALEDTGDATPGDPLAQRTEQTEPDAGD